MRSKGLGFVPFQGMDAKFRSGRARGVDAHAADAKQPLHQVLFDVHGLNAFKRDVDFFADEDALVHVEIAPWSR